MAETSSLDPDSLDELIGAIYDCVIDSTRWHDTLDRIRQRYRFYNAILGVNDGRTNESVLHVAVEIPNEMVPVIHAYGLQVLELWGGWEQISRVPLEEPIVHSQLMGRRNWNDNLYYRHFMAPQGIDDAVAIVLARDARTVANLAFGRHLSAPPLTEAEIDELRILAPHLRRAVVISRVLETSTATATTFAETLDASPAGVVLVDRKRHVVHANRVASAMLAAGDPIQSAGGGELQLVSEVVHGALQRAIETAGDATAGSKGMGVPARRLDGSPLVLQVMPLERRSGANTPLSAVAAVFVADSASGPATSAEILSVLFDLTPAEARIFALVVSGQSFTEIGTELSISSATAKTHLARIYQKTHQSSRAGLVRLAQDVAPSV